MTIPRMKIKTPVPFPATVAGTGGIAVSKSNGVWVIEPDFSQLSAVLASAIGDPTTKEIWLWDPVTDTYNVLTLAGLGDALFKLTSTTSLAVGTGSKVFSTQSGKDVAIGSWVLATDDANPTVNWMLGQVTAYSGTLLTIGVTTFGGTGTYADWTVRFSGPPGSARSAGLSYQWSTNTAASDPGAGFVKANNATFASITALYISETDADGNAIAAELATWGTGTSTIKGRLKIYDPVTPTNFQTFDATGFADSGAYDTLTVTPVATGGSFSASLLVRAHFTPKGDLGQTGAQGVNAGVNVNFEVVHDDGGASLGRLAPQQRDDRFGDRARDQRHFGGRRQPEHFGAGQHLGRQFDDGAPRHPDDPQGVGYVEVGAIRRHGGAHRQHDLAATHRRLSGRAGRLLRRGRARYVARAHRRCWRRISWRFDREPGSDRVRRERDRFVRWIDERPIADRRSRGADRADRDGRRHHYGGRRDGDRCRQGDVCDDGVGGAGDRGAMARQHCEPDPHDRQGVVERGARYLDGRGDRDAGYVHIYQRDVDARRRWPHAGEPDQSESGANRRDLSRSGRNRIAHDHELGTNYKFSGGTKPTLSTAASTVDVLAYHVKSSTEIECFFTGGMS